VIADNKNDFFDFEQEQEHLQILDSELIIGLKALTWGGDKEV